MKRLLSVALLALLLPACIRYGTGTSTGYIYAVDDGIVWDKVWFKPSLASTESDCYLLKDQALKAELQALKSDTNIKIHYTRHLMTVARCPEGTGTEDEITSFETVTPITPE